MWIVVILLGMLNSAGGLEAGHSEMTDVNAPFATLEQCEKSRAALTLEKIRPVEQHFGKDNIIYVSACWQTPGTDL